MMAFLDARTLVCLHGLSALLFPKCFGKLLKKSEMAVTTALKWSKELDFQKTIAARRSKDIRNGSFHQSAYQGKFFVMTARLFLKLR